MDVDKNVIEVREVTSGPVLARIALDPTGGDCKIEVSLSQRSGPMPSDKYAFEWTREALTRLGDDLKKACDEAARRVGEW